MDPGLGREPLPVVSVVLDDDGGAPLVPAPEVSAAPIDGDDEGLVDAKNPSGPKLVAIAMETYVQLRPSYRATRLCYLRAGAVVARAALPVGFDGCSGGC